MFGRQQQPPAEVPSVSRRHGRRPIRSSLTGAHLPDPNGRVIRFELAARSALEFLRQEVGDELEGVHIGFQTAPMFRGDAAANTAAGSTGGSQSEGLGEGQGESQMFFSIDRASRTIVLYRMPIQRAKGLHVDDADHRRYFIGHCVHRAVCEYLGRDPWEVAPGRFDHF